MRACTYIYIQVILYYIITIVCVPTNNNNNNITFYFIYDRGYDTHIRLIILYFIITVSPSPRRSALPPLQQPSLATSWYCYYFILLLPILVGMTFSRDLRERARVMRILRNESVVDCQSWPWRFNNNNNILL